MGSVPLAEPVPGQPLFDIERDAEAMCQVYDRDLGFADWHRLSRDRFARKRVPSGGSEFETLGFEKLRVLSGSHVRRMRNHVDSQERTLNNIIVHDNCTQDIVFGKREFLLWILGNIITHDIDSRLVRFFRSEYFVYWYSLNRTLPADQAKESFLWHRDGGPSAHAKLMVYLNGTEEHGAMTEFLDKETTVRIGTTGYQFPDVAHRVDDLSLFAFRIGAPYEPYCAPVAAGEALLFRARDVLHKGRLPTTAVRYVLTLCCLPSPVPWQKAFERSTFVELGGLRNWSLHFAEALTGAA